MGSIRKKVTHAVLAANRANSAASTGPSSGSGKEQSKRNAVKSGKYASRPDPVELLLSAPSEEEQLEREELRARSVRSYEPPDDFAREQAEELGDLRFELRRIERAKEVVLARERELLALEQRKRALRLKEEVEATSREVSDRGFAGQPDSPGKFRAMLRLLGTFVEEGRRVKTDDVRIMLNRLYGDGERAWRGVRMRWAVAEAEKAESDQEHEQTNQRFLHEAEREIELVREELEVCELEQGPLSKAGEAARLLEAMGSRKWSWLRQQETFLRRSIDRKVQVLIDLRREALLADRLATEVAHGRPSPDRNSDGNATAGGRDGGAAGGGDPAGGNDPAGGDDPTGGGGPVVASNPASPDPSPESQAPSSEEQSGSQNDGSASAPKVEPQTSNPGEGGAGNESLGAAENNSDGHLDSAGSSRSESRNRGTKPLSPLVSAEAWGPVGPWVIDIRDLPEAPKEPNTSEWELDKAWSPVGGS